MSKAKYRLVCDLRETLCDLYYAITEINVPQIEIEKAIKKAKKVLDDTE